MNYSSKDLIKILTKNGWQLKSVSGSHHKFIHPDNPGQQVIIPHPRTDMKKGTTNAILKQAGLK